MIIVPILITFIAGISTVLGSIFIFLNIKEKNINKFITFSLSLSLIIMILISITELIPEAIIAIFRNYSFLGALFIVLLVSITGYLAINTIDKLSKNTNNLYKLGIINMIVLILHNMPEGIITFLSSTQDTFLGLKLCIAIMLHNIPEGIAIAVPIFYGTKSKIKAISMTLISGLSEPLGAILTYFLFKDYITLNTLNIILLFVGVIMITLSINKMFPEAEKLKEPKYIMIGITTGFILITLLEFFF